MNLLNSEIISALGGLGHTDTIVISDCGLPIPEKVKKIDLALYPGSPSFKQVFEAISHEMEIERMTLASEIEIHNKDLFNYFDHFENGNVVKVSHEELKVQVEKAKCVIRTGENKPYANVILHAGVIF